MRRWFAFRRDLGLQLLALYLLLIIPFLVTLWIFDGLIGVRIREDVQASDLSLAQSISQEVELAITGALTTVEGLTKYPQVIEADGKGMEEIFRVILNTSPDVNLVYRLNSKWNDVVSLPHRTNIHSGPRFFLPRIFSTCAAYG